MSVSRTLLAAVAAGGLTVAAAAPAFADSPASAGTLTCRPDGAAMPGDRRPVRCVFTSADGAVREYYAGHIDRAALDSGGVSRASVTWTVTATSPRLRPGVLAGTYGNAGGTSSRVPRDAGVLVRGEGRTVTLRPAVSADRPAPAATSLTLRRIGTVEERVDPEPGIDVEPLPPRR